MNDRQLHHGSTPDAGSPEPARERVLRRDGGAWRSGGGDQLSVLIPVFNEERTIERVVRGVLELGSLVLEVVVVDDHSTDRTPQLLQRLAREDARVRILRHSANMGKTAAIRDAIAVARGEILVIQDADLEYNPAEIPALVRPIHEGHADVVYGSRFLVRREARVLYFYHYLANKMLTFCSNLLTNHNMTDVETGYKAFRACVLKPFQLTSRGYGMEIELTAMVCRTSARIYETPISYYGRTYEEGKKISLKDGLWALWYIFHYNLVAPWHPSRRAYVRRVNEALQGTASARRREPDLPGDETPCDGASPPTAATQQAPFQKVPRGETAAEV